MIRYVTAEDTAQILDMMESVKDDFAGYMEKEFMEALNKAIQQKEAVLEEERGRIGGMLIFFP